MGNKTSLSQDNQHTSTKLQGDVPFTDVDGKPIFLGDILEQMNFNEVPYMARYKVVFDPEENEVCLLLQTKKPCKIQVTVVLGKW